MRKLTCLPLLIAAAVPFAARAEDWPAIPADVYGPDDAFSADLKHIPVVFLSAKGQDNEIKAGLDAGAEEYLLKPFAPDYLTERVRAILAKFGKQ